MHSSTIDFNANKILINIISRCWMYHIVTKELKECEGTYTNITFKQKRESS